MVHDNSNDSMTSIECPFTILPIEGMEFVQNNFAKYKDGDRAAQEFVGTDRVTLSKRFKLLERGFSLQLKDTQQKRRTMFDGVKCVLECKKPVYANETKRSGMKKSEQVKGRSEVTAEKKSGVPLLQMQNLKISDGCN